ncbi:hypothetical protein LINPERHAP1_LOCUS36362 [Linum perenne]
MKQKNGACSELSEASKLLKFLDKSAPKLSTNHHHLRFCMGLSGVADTAPSSELIDCCRRVNISSTVDPQPSLQLALLPFSPIPRRPTTPATKAPSPEPLRFPWLVADPAPEEGDDGASLSLPNSVATSSFRMEFGIGGFGFPNINKKELEEGEKLMRVKMMRMDHEARSSDCTKSNLRFWKKASKNTTLLT